MKENIGDYLRQIREIRLVAVCVAVSALAASAYLAPVEERCGVRVEIGSFPQKTERPGKNPYALYALKDTMYAFARDGGTLYVDHFMDCESHPPRRLSFFGVNGTRACERAQGLV